MYRTANISLASVLLHEKYALVELDRSNARAEFVFEDSEELRRAVKSYWKDELMCPAQSLFAAFRRAKNILYDCTP
jgi:hypothetical protein